MAAAEPVEIEVVAGGVRMTWDDGHESLFPLRYIRGWCPCAGCQGHAGANTFVANEGPKVTGIDEVGAYALNIRFGAHNTGIFTFELLRRLCPCDACQREQGERHPLRRTPA